MVRRMLRCLCPARQPSDPISQQEEKQAAVEGERGAADVPQYHTGGIRGCERAHRRACSEEGTNYCPPPTSLFMCRARSTSLDTTRAPLRAARSRAHDTPAISREGAGLPGKRMKGPAPAPARCRVGTGATTIALPASPPAGSATCGTRQSCPSKRGRSDANGLRICWSGSLRAQLRYTHRGANVCKLV